MIGNRVRRGTWYGDRAHPGRRVGRAGSPRKSPNRGMPKDSQDRNARPDRPPGTVLVVDDDPVVRRMTARLLEAEGGLTVVEAGSGAEALALCAAQPIAVVVTDMVMPQMGGRDLGRQVRELWPKTQLLFITGFAEVDREGLPGELMLKPFPFAKFVAAVQALVDRYLDLAR